MADHGFDLDAIQRKLGGHSVFAPSYSSTWLRCLGSLLPSLLAEDDAGEDAAYGTVAHGVAERWLKTGLRPSDLVGEIEVVDEGHAKFEIEIDEVMLDFVQEYVDWCAYLPGSLLVEQRVDFSCLTPIPNQGGTADHIALEPGVLTITDLKMGKGVQVFATGNTQARLYALGAFFRWDWEYDFQRIVIRIAQPRLEHFDVWEISRDELLQFAEFAKGRAHAAWQPDAPRTPGEKQCQWCKVRRDCAARAAYVEKMLEGVFDALDDVVTDEDVIRLVDRLDDEFETVAFRMKPPRELTVAQRAKIIRSRRGIENWLKSIEDDLEKILQAGGVVPGFKLVEGRSNRIFPNSDRIPSTLEMLTGVPESEFVERKVCTPAQAEEILVKKGGYKRAQLPDLLGDLAVKPRGKPVMAPAHDKRPELSTNVDDVFDDLDTEDDL